MAVEGKESVCHHSALPTPTRHTHIEEYRPAQQRRLRGSTLLSEPNKDTKTNEDREAHQKYACNQHRCLKRRKHQCACLASVQLSTGIGILLHELPTILRLGGFFLLAVFRLLLFFRRGCGVTDIPWHSFNVHRRDRATVIIIVLFRSSTHCRSPLQNGERPMALPIF